MKLCVTKKTHRQAHENLQNEGFMCSKAHLTFKMGRYGRQGDVHIKFRQKIS